MESKILLIHLDLLTETLSGQTVPLHCRDIKAVDGAHVALDRWSKWGYTVLGLSDQTAIAKQGKSPDLVLQELTYILYNFPVVDAIYYDAGFVDQFNRLDKVKKTYQINATRFNSLLSAALSSALCHYSALSKNAWVVSDLPKDEEVSSSYGANYMTGDIWRVCLDASTSNELITN
jgi:hypothetical protein